MKNKLYLILAIVILSSCSPQRRLVRLLERFPPDTTSSTEIIYRDTTAQVTFHGDTASSERELPIPFLNADSIAKLLQLNTAQKGVIEDLNKQLANSFDIAPIYNKTELANSKAWVEDGVLKSELYQKDTIVDVPLDSAIRERTVINNVPYPVIEKANPFWKNGFLVLAGVVLLALLLYFVTRK